MMEQKKKVLFVATVVKTHINTFHLPFLKMFKEYGWEVHVAAKNDFVDEPCVIPNCDRHFDIDFARSPFSKSNIKAYKQLKQIIETNHYDIIHCHTPVAGVLTRLAARTAKGTTVIYTAHGFHFYQGAPLINWLVYYPVERVCGKFTDKLITVNQEDYHRANSWRLRNNGKIYYVHGIGVDLEEIQNISINKVQKKKEIGISNDVKVLLSVGELNKNKNHEIIIRVLSKLTNKNFIYLICGNGELKEYLKNLAKELGVSDKVKFLGYRKDVLEIEDLHINDKLEGTVRNVVDFGAFVDIGLHEDGLVHVSKMSTKRVKHPSDVVSVGDIVTVWVYNIDQEKQKVQLTMVNPN